jgi:hypothetical protein
MNSTTITKLYDQLSSKIGKETAESLIQFIEQKVREESKEQTRDLMVKRDLVNGLGTVKPEKKKWRWENPRRVWWFLAWLQLAVAAAVWLFHFLR